MTITIDFDKLWNLDCDLWIEHLILSNLYRLKICFKEPYGYGKPSQVVVFKSKNLQKVKDIAKMMHENGTKICQGTAINYFGGIRYTHGKTLIRVIKTEKDLQDVENESKEL